MVVTYLLAAIGTMALGAIGLYCLRNEGPTLRVRRWSEVTSWLALGFGVVFSIQTLLAPEMTPHGYFYAGPMQALLIPYILLMGVLVKRFAYHYIQSDEQYALFFLKIKLLMASLMIFVAINHAALLAITWVIAGWFMYSLITHTKTTAALASGRLALTTFLIGDLLVLAGVIGMMFISNSVYLSDWFANSSQLSSELTLLCLTSISVGAFSKTALIPFHQWLAHTLTAPTPVSAIMHAGFVNSGGILLAKLSPLIVNHQGLMVAVFAVGLLSALFGSTVMMVQTDVKRYLTFSTVGQMGFMMMECGLGAFHLAIFHLMIHGFFKARLFLSAGTIIEHRQAVRNVEHQQSQHLKTGSVLTRFITAGGILTICGLSVWIAGQIANTHQHLLQLHPILISFLALAVLFTTSVLIKVKGLNYRGAGIALVFSICILLFYLVYEGAAQQFLPELNYVQSTQGIWFYGLGTSILTILGLITWLLYQNIISLPATLKNKAYVYLLNMSGRVPFGSTFTHRT